MKRIHIFGVSLTYVHSSLTLTLYVQGLSASSLRPFTKFNVPHIQERNTMIRGRTKPLSKLEKEFWDRFPDLLIDDPEDELNQIVGLLRTTTNHYFRSNCHLMILDDPEQNVKLSWWKKHKLRKWYTKNFTK